MGFRTDPLTYCTTGGLTSRQRCLTTIVKVYVIVSGLDYEFDGLVARSTAGWIFKGRIKATPVGGLLGFVAFMMFHGAGRVRKTNVL